MNVLVKPFSDSDGNLVILADNTKEMHLVDVTTGEIIESGKNVGASNGRGATFRFPKPGSSYSNIGLMDDKGNVILTLTTAGDRVQFNYNDYNALIRTPVSTIEGYRWDNSKNIEAQTAGQISNADISKMTDEEYINFLEQQKGAAQASAPSTGSAVGLGAASIAAAAAPSIIEGLTASAPATPTVVGISPTLGAAAAPVPAATASATTAPAATAPGAFEGMAGAAGNIAGAITAGINAYDAFGNITKGDEKGQIEGVSTAIGTGIGAFLGGFPGAGIGSIAGRTVGRGLASVAGAFGVGQKSTKDYQKDRWGAIGEGVDPESPTGKYISDYQQEIANPQNKTPKKFEEMNSLELTPGAGFFETFGPDWLEKYSEPQRIEIARQAKERGLLESKRGDIEVKDQASLKEIGDQVFSSPEKLPTREELGFASPPPATSEAQADEGGTDGPVFRSLVPSDPGIEPPITGYQQIDGASLPPPGLDNAALAFNLIQSAPSSSLASGLYSEIFKTPGTEERLGDRGFSQIQGAFQ